MGLLHKLPTCGQMCGRSLPGSAIDCISNSDQNMDGGTRTPMVEMQRPPRAARMTGDLVSSKCPRPIFFTPLPTDRKRLHLVLETREDTEDTNRRAGKKGTSSTQGRCRSDGCFCVGGGGGRGGRGAQVSQEFALSWRPCSGIDKETAAKVFASLSVVSRPDNLFMRRAFPTTVAALEGKGFSWTRTERENAVHASIELTTWHRWRGHCHFQI